jgi:hypothetical protein
MGKITAAGLLPLKAAIQARQGGLLKAAAL